MRNLIITIACLISITTYGQLLDTAFFPLFTPYPQNPVINYGDGLAGSPWNDPTVLKGNNQYIMYMSGVEGGLNHPNDTVGIYRFTSPDGYSWSLNQVTPVLDAVAGTYYEGGVETPSVVFFKGEYHMYNTVYTVNDPFSFKISHATSLDGISWQIDNTPVLEPDTTLNWMNLITAEPGTMVKNDTLYLFFSALGTSGNQSIGLIRSIDGNNFFDTTLTATLPENVYLPSGNYAGLSTPSPVLVGDTIYLFTDVAQFVFGTWTQVALHQFKSYNNINKWYADTVPIHTRNDFPWSNTNYLGEIRSVTPLMDGNRLRIWYAGHNISEIDTILNDTINHVHFIGNELHVDSNFWAIGTSEYLFPIVSSVNDNDPINSEISINYYQNKGFIATKETSKSIAYVYAINGQLLLKKEFYGELAFDIAYHGTILIKVATENEVFTKKAFSF